MKTHAGKVEDEALAIRNLVQASRAYAAIRPQRNVSGFYARALKALLEAARVFARKSDEAWAADVAELRGELARVYGLHVQDCAMQKSCDCPEYARARELIG